MRSLDLTTSTGRVLRVHDSESPGAALTVVWHHGSPQSGALLDPLVATAERHHIRLIGYGRPGYGGSSAHPGRIVADAAADVATIADALDLDRFATVGYSGGGPHALACAARLGERVTAVATLAGIAPFPTPIGGVEAWFEGILADEGLRTARRGREARIEFAAVEGFDPEQFVPADWQTLAGIWAPLGPDAAGAGASSPEALSDDDVSFVNPWGFDLAEVVCPALFVHGDLDRVVPPHHAVTQFESVPSGFLLRSAGDGHVSVLCQLDPVLAWLASR